MLVSKILTVLWIFATAEMCPNFNVETEYAMMDSDADTKLLTVGANLKF